MARVLEPIDALKLDKALLIMFAALTYLLSALSVIISSNVAKILFFLNQN
jgi:hypothetical protein